MPRAKSGVVRKRRVKKVLKLAKGFRGAKGKLYRSAKNAVMKALAYSYRDRRQKKREFRRLWQVRINAAVRAYGMRYNEFINALKRANVVLNRKALSNLAIEDPDAFAKVVELAKRYKSEN